MDDVLEQRVELGGHGRVTPIDTMAEGAAGGEVDGGMLGAYAEERTGRRPACGIS